MIIRVDEKLAYYPSKKVAIRIKNLLLYLMQQKDKVMLSKVCDQFNVEGIWCERMDRANMLRISSVWCGYGNLKSGFRCPSIYLVVVHNRKKIEKMIADTPKASLPPSQRTEQTNKTLKLLEEQENEDHSQV